MKGQVWINGWELYVWQSCVKIEGYFVTSSSPHSNELLFLVSLSSGVSAPRSPTDEYVYSTQHFDLLQYYACRNVPQNGKKNDSIFALAAMCVCMYFGVLCLSVLALFWLSPARRVRCWAKLLLSMFGDGAKPVFGLHNTPGSSSRSLGSGSTLSTDWVLPDADWSIPSIHNIPIIYSCWWPIAWLKHWTMDLRPSMDSPMMA